MSKVLVLVLLLLTASVSHAEETTCDTPPRSVSHITFSGGVEESSAALLIKAIDQVTSSNPLAIVFEFNTPGGNVDAGFEIAKKIEGIKVPVYCVVDGMAASMGFYLLQSCPVRAMTRRSHLMAHEVRIENSDVLTPSVVENYRQQLEAYTQGYAEHSALRMTVDTDGFLRRIVRNQEWWFSWKTAMKFRAVDGVVGSVTEFIENVRAFETSKAGAKKD